MAVASSLALGCQQREGPVPERDSQTSNRLNDMKRDLENVAGGDRAAPGEFIDDLGVFTESEPELQAVRVMGRRVASVVSAKALAEETIVKLLDELWLAAAGREFSQRQQDTVREDIRALLMSAGVEAGAVESIVSQVGEVQGAVSRRSRRWYERY